MCIGCTKLQCFLIHHFHKLIHASANMLCYSNRSIIPGIDQQTMKKFIQCYLISFLKANLCGTGFLVQSLCRNCHYVVHIPILKCQNRCHNFCDTRRI